jgi:hypothetical protein
LYDTFISGREEAAVKGQDNDGFLLDLPLITIDFILPLYVEKPFTVVPMQQHQNHCEGFFISEF